MPMISNLDAKQEKKVTELLTSCATAGIKGKDSLDSDIHGGCVEGLEHNLSHFLTIGLRVERSFSEKHWMLLWSHTQLIVEGVMPDFFHIVPITNNAMLNWVF